MPDDRRLRPLDLEVIRFGCCTVNIAARELWRADERIAIEPKAFDLLVYLIAHRHRVVRKDELLDEIWRTTDISESALARMIMKVRRAIGDGTGARRLIETAQRIGYRFTGSLEGPAHADVPAREVIDGPRDLLAERHLAEPEKARRARRAFRRALWAARHGRLDLAFAHCLECGAWLPGCLEVSIDPVGRIVSESGQGRLILTWKAGSGETEHSLQSLVRGSASRP